MKYLIYLAATLPLAHSKTADQLCAGTVELGSDGNWYCSEVLAITYNNISQAGAYNRTTYIDSSTGLCGHETVQYPSTGSLAPLFGEVSMHLRGPMNISQLAVYQVPSEASKLKKRNTVPFYNRRRALEKRDIHHSSTDNIQPPNKRTWTSSAGCSSATTVTSTVTVTSCASILSSTSSSRPSSTQFSSPITDTTDFHKRAAAWDRVAYYTSAAPAQATGFSFLANLGDPRRSGTFDYAFGNSLSFVSPAGDVVASESEPFDGSLETSEYEIAVFSDKECDMDCPYWRPNATSHYAWAGSSKAFFIEFQMDHYQNRGSDYGLISDAPALWFLNAAIPRILQYGNDRNNIPCSCWSTGCGEFDAFEVLGTGVERAKSTIHRQGNLEGGDSNYFKRPVGRTLKFAVVWHFPHITVRVLDADFEFADALTEDDIDALVAYDPDSWVHSLFPIGD